MRKLTIVFFSFLLTIACNKKFDRLLQDPSSPSPSSADVDLFLNAAQIQFANVFSGYDAVGNIIGASDYGAQMVRMEAAAGGSTYADVYDPENFNDLWSNAYRGVLSNANNLIPLAEAQKKYTHAGMAKILKAYTMITLVDLFGDVPYTEALKGIENTNPGADPGRVVYDSALLLLDAAVWI